MPVTIQVPDLGTGPDTTTIETEYTAKQKFIANDLAMAAAINRITSRTVRAGQDGVAADGQSHPLSSAFGTLAAAQAAFPKAGISSLTQEFEWAACQHAINAVRDAGGGVVEIGDGTFVTTGTTLTFPSADEYGRSGVSMVGGYRESSTLAWLTDGAAGTFVVTCADRRVANKSSAGMFRDFGIKGPGGNSGFGTANCNVGGIAWGARRHCHSLLLTDLYSGIDVVGDHSTLSQVRVRSCYRGLDFSEPNPGLFGNLAIHGLQADACWHSTIFVSKNTSIAGSLITGGDSALDACPYGIFKEAGGSNNNAIESSVLVNLQFENIGNAALANGDYVFVQLQNCQFSYADGNSFQITGNPRRAIIDIGYAQHMEIMGIAAPFLFVPGTEASIRITNPVGVRIMGAIDNLISNAKTAGKPFFSVGDGYGPTKDHHVEVDQPSAWRGRVLQSEWGQTIIEGDFVRGVIGVRRTAGNTTDINAGIVKLAPLMGYGSMVVAFQGDVNANMAAAYSDGSLIYPGANGRGTTAVGTKAAAIVCGSSVNSDPYKTDVRLLSGLGT